MKRALTTVNMTHRVNRKRSTYNDSRNFQKRSLRRILHLDFGVAASPREIWSISAISLFERDINDAISNTDGLPSPRSHAAVLLASSEFFCVMCCFPSSAATEVSMFATY